MGKVKDRLLNTCDDDCADTGCTCIPTPEEAMKDLSEVLDALNPDLEGAIDSTFDPFEGMYPPPKCECGGDASGVGTHTDYCPKHKK